MKLIKLKAVNTNSKIVKKYVKAIEEGIGIKPSPGEWKPKKSKLAKSIKVFKNKKEAMEFANKIISDRKLKLTQDKKNQNKKIPKNYSFPPQG